MDMELEERNNEIIRRVSNGEDRNIIAVDLDVSLPTVSKVMTERSQSRDQLSAMRRSERIRRLHSHPCGIDKKEWRSCISGCHLCYKCDAYKNPQRRAMQTLEVECTECGHEHTVTDERLYRLGDSFMAVCPKCEMRTEHWIYNIIVPAKDAA